MILTCPQCATRYQADASKFPAAGRSVRCAKCGNVWHQLGPPPEPDPDTLEIEEQPIAQRGAPEPERRDDEPAPGIAAQPRFAAFAPAATAEDVIAEDRPEARQSGPWLGRAAIAGGWVLLVAIVLVIGWAAVSFRDSVTTWLPQTSSIYSAAGMPANPHGIDFADVAYQSQLEDGQQVLAVTGRIVNRSSHELSVPLVRVALFDRDRHELYHWTFVPGVSTLQPGTAARFRTRLSSPPAATHDLEVRFARSGE